MNDDRNPLIIKLIKTYQKNKTTSGHCKFYPTCSNYAIGCYKKFNFFYASLLVGIRILRCNYFAKRRYYPVPLSRKEKKQAQLLNDYRLKLNNDFIDYLLSANSICKSGAELYHYIYDYVNLPLHPTATQKENVIYGSRFVITNTPIIYKERESLNLNSYLDIATNLFNQGLLKNLPVEEVDSPKVDQYLVPLDELDEASLLAMAGISDGIVIINGDTKLKSYRDFTIIPFNGSLKEFKKKYRGRNKIILLSKNLKIYPYLEDISYAINLYKNYREVDYFYSVNKKAS